jgi:integron integrase
MTYMQYITEAHHVPKKNAHFYEQWIAQYLAYMQNPSSRSSDKLFFDQLEKNREQWQVRQARRAVRLYKHFAERKDDKSPNVTQEPTILWQGKISDMRSELRLRGRSPRTEKTYVDWVRRFSQFLRDKNISALGTGDVKRYLTYLAVDTGVSAATQNLAFNALLFFYRNVLEKEISDLDGAVRSHVSRRLPVVLTREEVAMVLKNLTSPYHLAGAMIYGSGMRLSECLSLRIKDVDLQRGSITVRSGKGDKDRQTIFPEMLRSEYDRQLATAKILFEEDRRLSRPGVPLPGALKKKYSNAASEWAWFWLFPSYKLSVDPRTGFPGRYHLYPTTLQRAVRTAVQKAGLSKNASVHTFRHSFATHLIEDGYDIRTIQELLGHSNVQTTMIYAHVATKNKLGVRSPLSALGKSGGFS